jgi:hypothetical protein
MELLDYLDELVVRENEELAVRVKEEHALRENEELTVRMKEEHAGGQGLALLSSRVHCRVTAVENSRPPK